MEGRAPQGEHPGAAAARGQLCPGSRGAGDRAEHEEGTVGQDPDPPAEPLSV